MLFGFDLVFDFSGEYSNLETFKMKNTIIM